MSDIVERLRVRRNPMLDGEREEAADEIERLRTALVADDEGSTAYQSGWHARDAEISDLNAGWQRTYDHDCGLMKAEIERLRGLSDITRLDVMWQELVRERDNAKREIDRLRAENSQWQSACAGYTEALAARDKENKELRYRLEKLEK